MRRRTGTLVGGLSAVLLVLGGCRDGRDAALVIPSIFQPEHKGEVVDPPMQPRLLVTPGRPRSCTGCASDGRAVPADSCRVVTPQGVSE